MEIVIRSCCIVASIFQPRYLTALDITVFYPDDSVQSSLEMPRILSLYLGQTPGMRTLMVTGSLKANPPATIYRGARGQSYSTSQFLSRLSSLNFLEKIDITEV
jgi:hypothetical protein